LLSSSTRSTARSLEQGGLIGGGGAAGPHRRRPAASPVIPLLLRWASSWRHVHPFSLPLPLLSCSAMRARSLGGRGRWWARRSLEEDLHHARYEGGGVRRHFPVVTKGRRCRRDSFIPFLEEAIKSPSAVGLSRLAALMPNGTISTITVISLTSVLVKTRPVSMEIS
jgi:hypothetical protein